MYFNPIIGLILTLNGSLKELGETNFNPIIGLILTQLLDTVRKEILLFQSHYRSDFNTQSCFIEETLDNISIPL